jgi:hypothetical protein
MFLHQIKYEWLQLTRDKWVTTLLEAISKIPHLVSG